MPRIGARRQPAASSAPPTGEQPAVGGLDGVRAWLAALDRRIRRLGIAGAVIVLVALATAGIAIYLALEASGDAATKSDLNEVRTKITAVEQSALSAADDDLAALGRQLESLEQRLTDQQRASSRNRSEIKVANDDIEDLRSDLSELSRRVSELETRSGSSDRSGSGGN